MNPKARVAELACGDGARTIALARRHPAAVFCGFDPDGSAIARARRDAALAGVSDRVTFEVARSHDYPGKGYDLVWQAAHGGGHVDARTRRHVLASLASGGRWIVLAPGDVAPAIPQTPGSLAPQQGTNHGTGRPQEAHRPRRSRQQEA